MKCRNPYIDNQGRAYGCGQCMPCRVAKRRIWTHRIMLEATQYGDNCMATLTYDDPSLLKYSSDKNGRGILVRKELQDWLKRFRKSIEPLRIRYFAAGEYGDLTWRPHFHVILFNYPNCRFGMSRYSNSRPDHCCAACDAVRNSWARGNIQLIELSTESAQYTCGYVTKKMTAKDDYRLDGRPPEFATMSLKPGIGAGVMHDVASDLMKFGLEDRLDDVPSSLRHGKRLLPLGRYLQNKLREAVGREKKAPQAVLDKIAQELQPLREAAFDNSRSFKKEIIQAADQSVLNMEARMKIRKTRREL